MILFVCLGNICRSPMAEFVMKDLIRKRNLDIEVMSAGLIRDHNGEDMHIKTREKLESKGIAPKGFQSKILTQDLCAKATLIVAMDKSNYREIASKFQKYQNKLSMLTDYIPNLGYEEVPDPWYSGDFDETYNLVLQGSLAILEKHSSFGQ
ncbi:hypothetical protein BBW65_07590 [Helicobacter enhydrae]|uniref:protein-tyrosine-phosphatase n=1 Tax=Helicobacter enhydrae TaxID=222136 RepID=A0A1B1U787_9HELI|nr:low molecular weight protein-tyrosine-phosphatase [Helicobacter enhydrae]ANV98667.1 hypothetical protein BBW65_07590 [Helicobacter enhydrae]